MKTGSGKVTYLKIAACVLIAVGVLVYWGGVSRGGAAVLPGRNAPPASQIPMVVPDSGRDTEVTFEQVIPRFKVVNEGGVTCYWFAYGTADGLVHVCHLPKQIAEGKYTRGVWKATFAVYDVEVRSRGSKDNIREYTINFLWDYPFASPPPRGKYVQVIVVNGREMRIVNEPSAPEPAAQQPPPATMAQAEPAPMPSAPSSFSMPSFPSGGGSSDVQRQQQENADQQRRMGEQTRRQQEDTQRQMQQQQSDNKRQMDEIKKQAEENAPVYYHCVHCGATMTRAKKDGGPSSFDGGDCPKSPGGGHFWVAR